MEDGCKPTSLEAAVPGIKERLVPLEAPQMAISSSDLRQRVATHRPIRYQVPEAVEAYILAHGLYSQTIPVLPDQRHQEPRHVY